MARYSFFKNLCAGTPEHPEAASRSSARFITESFETLTEEPIFAYSARGKLLGWVGLSESQQYRGMKLHKGKWLSKNAQSKSSAKKFVESARKAHWYTAQTTFDWSKLSLTESADRALVIADSLVALAEVEKGEKLKSGDFKGGKDEPSSSDEPGEGGRSKSLKKSLEQQKGVDDPDALAAQIGRAKYGKAKFQKMAAKGK